MKGVIGLRDFRERLEKYPEMIKLFVFIICGIALVYLTNNLFSVFAPFIVAYVVTQMLRPLMIRVRKLIKVHNAINTILCMLLFVAVALAVAYGFCYYLIEGRTQIINWLS